MEEADYVLSLPAFEPAWHTLFHSPEGAPLGVSTAKLACVLWSVYNQY